MGHLRSSEAVLGPLQDVSSSATRDRTLSGVLPRRPSVFWCVCRGHHPARTCLRAFLIALPFVLRALHPLVAWLPVRCWRRNCRAAILLRKSGSLASVSPSIPSISVLGDRFLSV